MIKFDENNWVTIDGWQAKVVIIALVVGAICLGAFIARAQDADPLLTDVRYFKQVRATLQQEQRANTMQIQLLQNRQAEIKNAIAAIDAKIKELEAPKDMVPTP